MAQDMAPPAKCGVPSADREPLKVSPNAQTAPPGTVNDSPPSWEIIEARACDTFQSEPKNLVWTMAKGLSTRDSGVKAGEHPETWTMTPMKSIKPVIGNGKFEPVFTTDSFCATEAINNFPLFSKKNKAACVKARLSHDFTPYHPRQALVRLRS